MPTSQHLDADGETLSALFDGELQGDAARFALKRLEHDARWRAACGRWQLGGDVLRGRAEALAPAGFAERVGAALAEEAAQESAVAGRQAVGANGTSRRRWIGGAALAASVALAALFVASPLSQPGGEPASEVLVAEGGTVVPVPSSPDAGQRLASQAPIAAPAAPAPSVPTGVGLAAAAVAVADRARPAASRRVARSPQPASDSTRRDDASPALATVPDTTLADSAMATQIETSPDHPFLPPGEIVSRPWPRAVLPGYQAGDAFTASFGSASSTGIGTSDESPFYPFEPRMLDIRSPGDGQVPSNVPNR